MRSIAAVAAEFELCRDASSDITVTMMPRLISGSAASDAVLPNVWHLVSFNGLPNPGSQVLTSDVASHLL
jgi:hypothetical protein